MLRTAPTFFSCSSDSLFDAASRHDCHAIRRIAGADLSLINRRDKNGLSPIDYALVHYSGSDEKPALDTIALLCAMGSVLTYPPDNISDSALHQAARLGFKQTVICLLQYGVDPRYKNADGFLPRETAQAAGQGEIEEIMMRVEALNDSAERGELCISVSDVLASVSVNDPELVKTARAFRSGGPSGSL